MAGFVFDEQKFINNNVFKLEDRLESQAVRFTDKSVTYTHYFNINETETTVDLGFSNIEGLLGPSSPLRYNEIVDFPILGIDVVQLRLEMDDMGLNSHYDGEALIMPNTIVPTPYDFFLINYLELDFLFMVTSVNYDSIKSNNYYQIEYKVKYIDKAKIKELYAQVTGKYKCINTNIGTDDKAIIESAAYEVLQNISSVYNNMAERYKMHFYNEKYNSFLFRNCQGYTIYDRYLSAFLQKYSLFNNKDDHMTIMVNNEDESNDFLFEYDLSIYRALELKRPDLIKRYAFSVKPIEYLYSVFKHYGDDSVISVRYKRGEFCYIHEPFTTAMKSGDFKSCTCEHTMENLLPADRERNIVVTNNLYHDKCPIRPFDAIEKLTIQYFHNEPKTVYEIDVEELNKLIFFDYNWENFIKIPIFLYILRYNYNKFLNQ